ncbi:MAG: hypothetical protein CVV04_07025 [Firmicutes bacterium HGW-Firmicutes-9]|jgi:hypothetical protein|nr:MAG: hypothetical protein CVV04_07025 [Firmicutes bacterium HGW-Firmicutes-9]
MKTTIKAINTYKYYYAVYVQLFLLILAVILVITMKEKGEFIVILGLLLFEEAIFFGTVGAFVTTRVKLSKEGFVQTCWFGLRRYEVKWEECIGYVFVFSQMQVYTTPFILFSKEWVFKGINQDGTFDWEYYRYEPGHYSNPRVGIDLCQLEYTPKMYRVLREYLPEHIWKELDERTNAYQEALPMISPYVKARNFIGIGKKK